MDRSQPKTPNELTEHNCINLRLTTYGGLYAWEFERNGRKLNVRVEGQLVFNSSTPILEAALSGLGLAIRARGHGGALRRGWAGQRVLKTWCPQFDGYHLYYPSRRQTSPAFGVLVEALRYRGK